MRFVFLFEAASLAILGALIGILVSWGISTLTQLAVPDLPLRTPTLYVVLALAMSLIVGLASGVLSAERAAGLEPIDALRAE